MATYPATNTLADLVATNPTGAEDAGKADDALRETRLVFKTVLQLIHTDLGGLKVGVWKDKEVIAPGAGYPAPAGINTWHDHELTRVVNIGPIDASSNANLLKPVSGVHLFFAMSPGFRLDRHQIRLFNATDTAAVANLYGSIAYAPDTNGGESVSTIVGVLTTDGTKSYKLQHIHEKNNTANGWGVGRVNNANWTIAEDVYSQILMLKIG